MTPLHGRDLARFLPAELAEALRVAVPAPHTLAEALVHCTAARYAVGTYLPRHLLRRQLGSDHPTPWINWTDGSLLFADISGSTALAERLGTLGREGTELVTESLNEFLGATLAVLTEYGGDVLVFGGDALLVLFDGTNHQHTAAAAAIRLQQALQGFEREVAGVGRFPLQLHIGVESGWLALASVGDHESLRHLALGPPVNRVAAAEEHAQAGQVVLGPTTWAAVATIATGHEVANGYWLLEAVAPCTPQPYDEPVLAAHDDPLAEMSTLTGEIDRLAPYLPPSLLSRILADPLRPLVEADLRPVTVLFAHVIGLSTVIESLDAPHAAQALGLYIGTMQQALRRYGGVVNKIDASEQGDKILALFGAPLAYEDHAERAVLAALAMQQALAEVNQRLIADCGLAPTATPLLQRIGINTGTVFAGNVGSDDRKEYTVMGLAVNTAARVMAHATWGSTFVSPTTLAATDARFAYSDQGAFELKGKRAPLHLHRLDGERAQPDVATPASPFIGRESELFWLRERLRRAVAGQGTAVRVVGEAGVGKSRLIDELIAEARRLGMQVISAANFSYTANIPYTPWAEWLKARCGIAHGDGPERRTTLLAGRLAELGSGQEEWLPLLADLVRLEAEDNRLTRALDPQLRQERRFELLRRLVLAAAHEAPLLTLIEDLHWADPISLDLWRQLAADLPSHPILLLGVHRPTSILANGDDGAEVLSLGELSAADSEALVQTRFGGRLPAATSRRLVERAAGNPLYIEELLRALVERGLLRETSGAYDVVGDLASIELPDSLNGLLLSRIDRLDEGWRNLLRVASVIGQRFPFNVLRGVSSNNMHSTLAALTGLTEQALIEAERDDPERVDIFRHALIQEVAYQSLLYARRRELHGRIGDYLERIHAASLDDYCGLLAHHYRLSDRHEKAIIYLLKAGDAARAIFANDEAAQHYRWALEALGEGEPRSWLARESLADVLAVEGRYDEALATYGAILAQPTLPPATQAEARRKQGSVLEKQGRYHEALAALREVEALIATHEATLPPLARPTLCADLATVLIRQGDYAAASEACRSGLAALVQDHRSRDDELIEARLHATVGAINVMRGDYDQARGAFERSLVARSAIDDLVGVVTCHNNLGYLWQLQSDYEQAMQHYAVAEETARQLGLRYALYFTFANGAYAAYCLGRYDAAEAQAREALALCEQMNNSSGKAMVLDTLGFIHYSRGHYQQAGAAFATSIELHRSLGSSYQEGNTLAAGLALVANATGRPADGLSLARQALQRGHELQAQQLQLEALNAAAEAHLLLAQPHQAWDAAAQAVSLARSLGNRSDRAVSFRLLGEAAAALEEPFDRFFEWSIRLANEIGNPFQQARALRAFGEASWRGETRSSALTYLKAAHHTFMQLGSVAESSRIEPLIKQIEEHDAATRC